MADLENTLHVLMSVDCESTQSHVDDAALGERATAGFAEVVESFGWKGTFYVIPPDAEAHAGLYRKLGGAGHELALHVHPAEQGYEEFLGIYDADTQAEILNAATDRAGVAFGERPVSVSIGYASTNDFTMTALEVAALRQGMVSIPSRVLPECASVHAGAPLDMYFGHRYNRVLVGDVDFVSIPNTLDPDSRMWGGKHPQDLRVELVDAKNHWYTIDKAVTRQVKAGVKVKYVQAVTHNIFEFGVKGDFRRDTLSGICGHIKAIAEKRGLTIKPVTVAEAAAIYREATPRGSNASHLTLDRRGYAAAK